MFTAKKLFSFFDYLVIAHAIITKIIGLVYLFSKIISEKKYFKLFLWPFGSNLAPKTG